MSEDRSQKNISSDGWSSSSQNLSSSSLRLKKSSMKTQSTQTVVRNEKPKKPPVPPAYLTLSPRLNQKYSQKEPSKQNHAVQTTENSPGTDNETIESIIVTKYILNGRKNRTRPKSLPVTPLQDGPSKEIMVSFKPQKVAVLKTSSFRHKHRSAESDQKRKQHSKKEDPDASETTSVSESVIKSAERDMSPKGQRKKEQAKHKTIIYKDIITITGNIDNKSKNVSSESIVAPNESNEEVTGTKKTIITLKDLEKLVPSLLPGSKSKIEGVSETDVISPSENSEKTLIIDATSITHDDSDDAFSNDGKDTTSIDITSLLETSPPSPSQGTFISDSPIEPPPSFAGNSPDLSPPPRPNRHVQQCFSLDLPNRAKVNFCPQSVSLDNMLLLSPESKSSNEYYTASSAEEFLLSHMRRHSASPSVSLERLADCILTDQQATSAEGSFDYTNTLRRNSSKKGTLKRDKHVEYDDAEVKDVVDASSTKIKSKPWKRMASTGEASDDLTLTQGDDDDSDGSLTVTPPVVNGVTFTPEHEFGFNKKTLVSDHDAQLVPEPKKHVKRSKKDICSPESDSSSSHFTGRETSRSDGSIGTLKSESDHEQQHETSAEYITATDNSNQSHKIDGSTSNNNAKDDARTSVDSTSSKFSTPSDTMKKQESATGEQKEQFITIQEAIINHKQQQRRHFLKERMVRLERRRKQIEKGMCSTSTESSNSGSYVIESMCKDEPSEPIPESPVPQSSSPPATEYPIEVNVTTKYLCEDSNSPTAESKPMTADDIDENEEEEDDREPKGDIGAERNTLKKHSSADGLESSNPSSFLPREKRRTRSASRSPDNTLSCGPEYNQGLVRDSPMAHSHTGVFSIDNGRRSGDKSRSEMFSSRGNLVSKEVRKRRERIHSKSASTESPSVRSTASLSSYNTAYHDGSSLSITTIEGADDDDIGVHSESYRSANWLYINSYDEGAVWKKRTKESEEMMELQRCPSVKSTLSEKEFSKKYQSITHRMVHRRASIEMFRRIAKVGKLEVDLKVEITRKNTEYGFRINGSRPVVISAIEPGTPAETCSLEIGDIIISVNDVNVLEFNHGEVVELAHTGEVLTLEIARTIDCILPSTDEKDRQLPKEDPLQSKQTGYIYKLCDKGQVWKRRWFSLDTDTKILLFYKNKQDREPLGVTYLPHYKPPEQITDHARPFTFQLTAHSPGGQPLTLSAGRQNEASRWMCLLTDVMAAVQIDPFVNKSVRNACLPPSSNDKPDCQGYLGNLCTQKGNKTITCRRRYYILKDACIYIYSDYYAENAIGVYHLHGYRVQSCTIPGKRNTFEAIPPNQKLKYFQFISESEVEKKKWLSAMEYSIDRWMKLS